MRNFWKNKRVLITGYEGFLGSNLTKSLLAYGACIHGLDILTHRKTTILSGDFKKINITRGSVENYKLVFKLIRKNKIEFVFHLAAVALVGEASHNPTKAFNTNIKGTWNVLEACRLSPSVKAVVIASSDKAYGSHKDLPYFEDYFLRGVYPYDVSKSCADMLAHAYRHTYGLPVCVTRCGNIFGEGDFNFSRIIPDAIRSISKKKTLFIRSDGKFRRDYVYVKDIVDAYLLLGSKITALDIGGQAFNFSYGKPLSVLGIVKAVHKICGVRPDFKVLNAARHEIKNQYSSSDKARRVLAWRPNYTLEEGLRKTVEWYKDFFRAK